MLGAHLGQSQESLLPATNLMAILETLAAPKEPLQRVRALHCHQIMLTQGSTPPERHPYYTQLHEVVLGQRTKFEGGYYFV